MNCDVKKLKESIVKWIKDTVGDCTVVIGISGGTDSSVCAALCVEALGKDKVFGVLMPDGEQKDIDKSLELVNHLTIDYTIINIGELTSTLRYTMHHANLQFGEGNEKFKFIIDDKGSHYNDVYETNTPARIRMTTLYGVAAILGNSRVINTCNLSEDWVGYSTKFGDSAGDFSPLAMITKTEVKQLGYELGLPKDLVEKVPSDGMSGMSDEEKLGFTYEELDKYIRTGEIGNLEHKARIDRMHRMNLHKIEPMPKFESHLTIEAEKGYARLQELKPYIERLGIKEPQLMNSYDKYIASCAKLIYDADGDYRVKWNEEINVYTSEHTLVSILKKIEVETNCEITKIWLDIFGENEPLYDSDGVYQGEGIVESFILELSNGSDYILRFDDPDDCK